MFSQLFSRMVGRGCGSCGSTSRRRQPRPARRIAAAAGQAIDALESRVLLSTIYVDASAPGPTYSGSSWTTAYKDLQLALSASASGDEIRIAGGTYKPTSTTDRAISFALRDGVAIRGGYAGYGTADPDARDIALYPTILSGNIGAVGSSADNSYHVATATGVGASTVLDGVTVTGGNANGIGSNQGYGGGLYATGSSLIMISCAISGNSAKGFGGGMYNASSSSPKLTNCTFSGNWAGGDGSGYGGGIYNSSSSPTLTNCTISGNTASGIYPSGGGIYNASSSSPKLTNCIVWGNDGGAVYNYSGTPTITYSNIQGGYTGTSNISAAPLFVRSPWTGPDGIFGTPDDDRGDLRLRSGSPALNTGSNAAVSGIGTDLAGNARIQNGTVDLGAYEGVIAPPASKTLYVDLAATSGTNTGTAWANAFTSLQSALAAAGAGDTICVADGTYRPTSGTDRTLSFALRDGVAVYGGYAGYGAADPNARDTVAYPTILSGDIGTAGSTGDNSYHVATATGVGPSTVLDGITVTEGNANRIAMKQQYGGGLYLTGASPTLINCAFIGNSASTYGGGIYNYASSPTLTNCALSGNSATGHPGGTSGGGMYSYSSSPTLSNCTFSGNAARSGGGMHNYFSSPKLTNCIVWGNDGGAVYNSSSTPTITYSNIQGGFTGTGNIDADPLFMRSPWTGPDGLFGTPDDDGGDLRLRLGSPAVNVGSNASVAGVSTDLAGNARIQGGIVDMGAYEGGIAPPAPKTLYVDLVATSGANAGTSWANAFTSLQSALAVSGAGDTIRVADGTYRPTSSTDRTISFSLRDAVAIHGGYAGYGAPDPDSRDTVAYPTILSGDIGTIGSTANNSYHVVIAIGVGPWTVLDGVTVTAGNADGTDYQLYGGGLLAVASSPMLINCTISGNSASGTSSRGGGMYNLSSSPMLISCTFSGNSAGAGGGIYNSSSSPTLVNCAFRGNSSSGGDGGGIYNSSSFPKLTNCTFSGNSAGGSGGGLYNSSSSLTLVNCTISGNSAGGTSFSGGAIYNVSSSLTLTNCILWGNTAWTDPQIGRTGGTLTITYSDIQGGYSGIGNISAEPLFIRAPWTGPDGAFGTTDDDLGDLRLREGSPVLNIGSNAAVSGVSTDQAGNDRIQNGTVDLGAHEGPIAVPASRTLYVDAAATGAHTGISWADAFTSLASALAGVSDGDVVRMADGIYKPTSTTDRMTSFALRNGVAIHGGYAGYGASDPDARDIALYPTILSGDIGAFGSMADNSYHVVTASGVSSSTVLDGVTVTLGNADGALWKYSYGGGLYLTGASPTLVNCTISGNLASIYGGGMYNASASPTLKNCALSGNSATGRSSSGVYGGGIYNHSSSPTLINCTFSGNSASQSGGGMYNSSSSPTLTNCILWGNINGTITNSGSTSVIAYSNIQGGFTGTGNINADPLFVRSPSPGPDGNWGTADDDYGDLRLQPGSPCIDRGNNAASGLAGTNTDLAGKPRFVDIALTPDAGFGTPPIIDMGAYEAQWACPAWLDPAEVAVWDAGDYSLDIGSGVLTVAADDANRSERLAAIRQAIALGRNTGAGIVSSAAGDDRGVIVALDAEGNILIRLALLGDVTLDEQIDGDDYFAMDMAFLAGGGLRPAADVNVDGVVDGRDYLMLDLRFLRSAVGGVQQAAGPVAQAGQQTPAGVFSTRSIAEELLMEAAAVLA